MRRCRVKVVIEFFNVLAVVPLMSCNAEKAFLEDWILAVPKRQGEAKALVVI